MRSLRRENKELKKRVDLKPQKEIVTVDNKEEIEKLSIEIKELKREKDNYQFIVQGLEEKVSSHTGEASGLKEELDALRSEYSSVVNRLNKQVEERESTVSRVVELQRTQGSEIKRLKAQLDAAEENIDTAHDTSKKDVEKYESRITKLVSQKNEYKNENEKLYLEIESINERYNELQQQTQEEQMGLHDFFNKDLRKKDQALADLQREMEGIKDNHRKEIAALSSENVKKIEQREELRQSAWFAEKDLLNIQVKELKDQLEDHKRRQETLENQKDDFQSTRVELENLRFVNTNLKNDLQENKGYLNEAQKQNQEMFGRLEAKNAEIKAMVLYKEKFERGQEETASYKARLNAMEAEALQINSDVKAQKERIKELLKSLEKASEDKLFYDVKVERLENRLYDLLFKDNRVEKKGEQSKLKEEVMSGLKRT